MAVEESQRNAAQTHEIALKESTQLFIWNWVVLGLILMLAAALYFYRLDYRGLWIDELISIGDANDLGLTNHFNRGRLLYYVLLRGWMTISRSDAWLRSLAALFGLASILLIHWLGRSLWNKQVGLIAAFLLTISPVFINHAQEVRFYTMSVCFGIAGTIALSSIFKTKTAKARWGWIILRFLAILSTPLNASLLIADWVLILTVFRKQRSLIFKLAQSFVCLCLLCIPVAISLYVDSSGHKPNPPVPSIAAAIRELRFLTAFPFPPQPPIETLFFQGFIFMLMGMIGVALITKPRSQSLSWIAVWLFIPAALFFLFSHLVDSIWITRYLLLICPYLLILLAVGFYKLWHHWRFVAIAVALIYLIANGYGLEQYYTRTHRYIGATVDYRSIVQPIVAQQQPGDIIVWSIHHNRPSLPLDHYYSGDAPIYFKELAPSGTAPKTEQDQWLQSLPTVRSRLWLVCKLDDDPQALMTALNSQFQIQQHDENEEVHRFLLVPKSSIARNDEL
jgi:mannosyltransferase